MAQYYVVSDELCHHGILGMKWGVRRYQNTDGSLTAAGKRRYNGGSVNDARAKYKSAKKEFNKSFNAYNNRRHQAYSFSAKKRKANTQRFEDAMKKGEVLRKAEQEYKTAKKTDKINRSADRKLARSSKYDQAILSARSRNRERIQNSGNKKIEKASRQYDADYVDAVKAHQKAKIKDFDVGTRMVKDGQDHYNRVISSYRDAKLSALDNKAFKKSPEYKQAVKDYTHQALIDSMYGQSYTKLLYASDAAKRK